MNFRLEGFPRARQSKIGYCSTVDTFGPYLPGRAVRRVDGGEGRGGGCLEDRSQRLFVRNTRPTSLEYHTEKWNEFLAA